MKILSTIAMAGLLTATIPAQADDQWKASETVKTYAISGTTGPALYAAIGEKGPLVGGKMRVIAHTTYVLTWDRKFDQSNNGCRIVSATPKLKITYTLPQPSAKLAAPVRENWARFIDGIRRHELVHGDHAKQITREIVQQSIGMFEANDPKCQKVRRNLINLIEGKVVEQKAMGRDFDRVEMGNGGNVQQLVLALVNGG